MDFGGVGFVNATFTVHFKGVPERFAVALEKMLHDDISGYPERMSMDSAAVELDIDVPTIETVKEPKAKKVKKNAKPRQR